MVRFRGLRTPLSRIRPQSTLGDRARQRDSLVGADRESPADAGDVRQAQYVKLWPRTQEEHRTVARPHAAFGSTLRH
jgi:hypothetical protein